MPFLGGIIIVVEFEESLFKSLLRKNIQRKFSIIIQILTVFLLEKHLSTTMEVKEE